MLILYLAASLLAQTDLAPETLLLSRVRRRMADNLSRLPNYTCLETIERSQRSSPSARFKPLDKVRVEVALVNGRELFSWPGAGKFEDRPLTDLVPAGLTSTGDFANHARTVFATRVPSFEYAGEEVLKGRRAVRYNYRVTQALSRYVMRSGEAEAVVGHHGAFWADRDTLDLVRLEVEADEIPAKLSLSRAVTEIEYAKVRVGASDFLLPQVVQVSLAHLSGNDDRNRTEFTGCRQYATEVALSFDESSGTSARGERQPPQLIDLPSGLFVYARLETPIDSRRSAVGDLVTAVVDAPVKRDGRLVVPKGAVVRSRLRFIQKQDGRSTYYLVGLDLFSIEFENKQAVLGGHLEEISQIPGVSARQSPQVISDRVPGISTIYVPRSYVYLPQGVRMLWRTTAP